MSCFNPGVESPASVATPGLPVPGNATKVWGRIGGRPPGVASPMLPLKGNATEMRTGPGTQPVPWHSGGSEGDHGVKAAGARHPNVLSSAEA